MKKNNFVFILLFCLILVEPIFSFHEAAAFKISSQSKSQIDLEASKIKGIILSVGDDEWLGRVCKIVNYDLDFTDQIKPDFKKVKKSPSNEIFEKLAKQKYSFCCLLEKVDNVRVEGKVNSYQKDLQSLLVVKLLNTHSKEVLCNSIFPYQDKDYIDTGHLISDQILKTMTGDSIALSQLAYCKTLSPKIKVICRSDYACKKEEVVVSNNSVNFAPSWHPFLDVIFYTNLTKFNNRLMCVDLIKKTHKIVSSFEGLNMQVAVSPDGKRAILCLSVNGNSELYLYDHEQCLKIGKRAYKQLTFNKGNNVAPCLLPNEDLIFCSDFETKLPQLYYLNMKDTSVHKLTSGGYCTSPAYSEKHNSVIYSKSVNGTFQIFKMQLDHGCRVLSDTQLTFGPGDKQEPCWSPCGKYIAFTHYFLNNENKRVSQISVLNLASKILRIITCGNDCKNYPVWRAVSS